MTLYTKKRYQGKRKGRNTLSLKRFKGEKTPKWYKRKQYELSVFNRNEDDGMFLLQQMGIRKGKKSDSVKRASEILYKIKRKFPNRDARSIVTQILLQYRTLIFLKSKKLGSVTYKIPISLFKVKGMRVIARWLMYNDKEKNLSSKEASQEQIVNLLRRRGDIFKKRLELHKVGYNGIPYLTYVRRERVK